MLHCEKYDKETKAEIDCRGITIFSKDEEGKWQSYEQLSMMEKKNILLVVEMKTLGVKYITPQSAEWLHSLYN